MIAKLKRREFITLLGGVAARGARAAAGDAHPDTSRQHRRCSWLPSPRGRLHYADRLRGPRPTLN
jgi:hypothetical protein